MSVKVQNIQGENWFKIPDHDSMRPFFMSVVSHSNHWMFVSSNGGITAGRKNADYALFPYYTDDKITDLSETTGSKTIFRVSAANGNIQLWEPFTRRYDEPFRLTRNLYKNRFGNKLMFEEENHDLGLIFRYQLCSSHTYGIVKKSSLINISDGKCTVKLLDGLQNILPYGVSSDLQMRSSNLVDAYKRQELEGESGLGIFALSAIIVDKAEPSEALKANAVWSVGLPETRHLLSSLQLDTFRQQGEIQEEHDVKGEKGAYFVQSELQLDPDASHKWLTAADVNLNQNQIVRLSRTIREDENLAKKVEEDIENGTQKLKELVAGADGLQKTDDPLRDARHYSNVLFNIMRGGTFDYNYRIEKNDFLAYLRNASKDTYNRSISLLDGLDDTFDKFELDTFLQDQQNADLLRLGKEYLPLKFSRRHGDPSRPWNQFSINTQSEDGSKILDYEGNWRDIFQNWEALAHSYPGFVEGMITRFLNASTFDGYNPYRVTKDGFDWETIEPDDPWSYIGYWGDHQIIYLLKFLEFYRDYRPGAFGELFGSEAFVYANVPYRIKPYDEIVKDPKDTILFDEEADLEIRRNIEQKGADGALLGSQKDVIHHVTFMEKILATLLAKVSNFIPGAGIWMNTQRPEWNDANNALVGNGVSMVTLCYLRRFLEFFRSALNDHNPDNVNVSEELAVCFDEIRKILSEHAGLLDQAIDDASRMEITESLGRAGSRYRETIYKNGFSGKSRSLAARELHDFLDVTLRYLDHTIRTNERDDHLYHAYNLMSMESGGITVSRLEEMLEGQVAVLSSGLLSAEDSLDVLNALKNSALYREDQQSYILYPNKRLPGFLEKNNIPESSVKQSFLLQKLLFDENRQVITRDDEGGYHFNGNFKNARDLEKVLDELESSQYASLVKKERRKVLQIFEEVFDHKAFTGRSGTFFAFEGLGSIYWHMVSKLHLAVAEVCRQAAEEGAGEKVQEALATHFDEIGNGIGVHKPAEVYGAFPTDPYSHTPAHRGAQQPGMTGQVKEDILTRYIELGVSIRNGELQFNPFLLTADQFTGEKSEFKTVSKNGEPDSRSLPESALGFTFCQVPVLYRAGTDYAIEVEKSDGTTDRVNSQTLSEQASEQIFHRTGGVRQVTVTIPETLLRKTHHQTRSQ